MKTNRSEEVQDKVRAAMAAENLSLAHRTIEMALESGKIDMAMFRMLERLCDDPS
jgi:hypothetical protein